MLLIYADFVWLIRDTQLTLLKCVYHSYVVIVFGLFWRRGIAFGFILGKNYNKKESIYEYVLVSFVRYTLPFEQATNKTCVYIHK